jgi:HlyD family secretion protein
VQVATGTPAAIRVYGSEREWAGRVRFVASEAAFTPYYALNERDRSRLSYLAEVELTEADAASLPVGVPVEVVLEAGAPP